MTETLDGVEDEGRRSAPAQKYSLLRSALAMQNVFRFQIKNSNSSQQDTVRTELELLAKNW